MPIGLLIYAGLVTVAMGAALWPPSRSGPLGVVTWFATALPNESPFLAFYALGLSVLLAFFQGDLHGVPVWVALGIAAAAFAGTPVLVRRSMRAGPMIEEAFDRVIGPRWRHAGSRQSIASTLPWGRIVFAPLPLFHPGVKRISNLSYGDAGRRNRLDLYRRRSGGTGRPVLIHLHGGGSSFAPGRKSFYARRILFRLARQGWVCISPNYRLQPAASFPDALIDVKKVIAWVRANVHEHGGDPDRIVIAGSSFGARLATLAGFTANDPAFQPGFELANTSVAAVVGLYGYYGGIASRQGLPSSPFDYAGRGSPPLLIVHGDQDTLTPPGRARALSEQVRSASTNPVVYVELPGAQHSFDLLSSIRVEAVGDGIEAFAASTEAGGARLTGSDTFMCASAREDGQSGHDSGTRLDLCIRPAEAEEGELLREIATGAKGSWGYDLERVKEWAALGDFSPAGLRQKSLYVAAVEGRPVGWAAAIGQAEVWWLDDLWVAPEWMGKGIGSRLFRHAAEQARAAGACRMEWESEPNALGFYERMGGRYLRDSEPGVWGRINPVMGLDLS